MTRVKSWTEPVWNMIEPIIGDWRQEKRAVKMAEDAIENAGEQAEKRPAAASKFAITGGC